MLQIRRQGSGLLATVLAVLIVGPCAVAARRSRSRRISLSVQQPPPEGGATVISDDKVVPARHRSRTYLIASFPELEQVAYCHTPDNVWRPLVTGVGLTGPTAVTVDSQNARLFVADPGTGVIWYYSLGVRGDGLLETQGPRRAAVQGYTAHWIAVNGIGDLYFVGYSGVVNGSSIPDKSIFRQDAVAIARGDPLNPIEVYNQANTGAPNSKVWQPSGLAVDSFFIYWGNQADGTTHGSIVKGSRLNIGLAAQDLTQQVLNDAFPEVRGITGTGTHIFYLTPTGVHGVLKTESTVSDPQIGLIAIDPESTNSSWNLTDIAWDGGNTLYITDTAAGAVYTVPALNAHAHNLTKFVDAPNIHGVSVYLHVETSDAHSRADSWSPVTATLLALGGATLAGARLGRGA